jgi:hypothetical protein
MFGLVLAVIGFGQVLLTFYPTSGFGSPEWEFGAMAQALGGLPLATIGIGAMLATALALDSPVGLTTLAVLLALAGIAVLAMLALFWSVVPLALQGAPTLVLDSIKQTVAKTSLLGAGFTMLYGAMAVYATRRAVLSRRRLNRD